MWYSLLLECEENCQKKMMDSLNVFGASFDQLREIKGEGHWESISHIPNKGSTRLRKRKKVEDQPLLKEEGRRKKDHSSGNHR